ncbi:MAG: 6-bladed beta-propeller [Acidobacteria bacterium]|nr:6-bladed beta-propeller [Acidobacteriota bacterium]
MRTHAERFLARAILVMVLSVTSVGFGQVVENPAKPKAKNAGRVVVPKEVLAISDEGTRDYYFKAPHDLMIAPDGSLFLLDEYQVLQFDKSGKFVRDLYKKGQGPGEMSYVRACLTTDKNVIVLSDSPHRLLFFDYSGKYEKEVPVRAAGWYKMKTLLFKRGTFYIQTAESPRVKGNPDYVDVPHTIIALNGATSEFRKLSSLSERAFVVTSSSGRQTSLFEISTFIAVPFKGKYLALTHTSKYLLKIYDPAADKVVRAFRRAYERVKAEPLTEEQKKGGIIIDGKHYGPPELKFQNDIRNLFTRGQEIWAVTSTKDKAKGVLVDIFDGEGVYRDCFYLKLPEKAVTGGLSPGSCALDGDFLWIVERTEDETATIKKYRVVI